MSARSNRIGLVLAFAFVASTGGIAIAQQPDPHAGHKTDPAGQVGGDQTFVQTAAVGNMAEIEAAKLALQKSSNEKVRAFAQQLVADHTKAGEELKAAASQQGITVPAQIDAEHQAAIDKLKSLSGEQFDAAFKAHMVEDHRKDIALFEKEAASGQSAVDNFASKTLPTLKMHLKMAEQLPGGSTATNR